MNQHDYETLLLAALLHDTGALFGMDTPASVKEAEGNPALASILAAAEKCATPGGRHDSALAGSPLASIFSFLRHHAAEGIPPRYFDFAPLLASSSPAADYIFPVATPSNSRSEYVKRLHTEFDSLTQQTASADFATRFNHLVALFHKFAWCLPAHQDDVCLYDHLRLTTAAAACLFQLPQASAQADHPFILAVGDLSGIQEYIFDIAAMGAAGASRRLRARSFSIALISDLASHALADSFGLPLTNILMSSGGKFYVLLPNSPDAGTKLASFRHDVDEWLYREYHCEIGLNLAQRPVAERQLGASRGGEEGFGAFIARLNQELGVAKNRRAATILQDADGWVEDRFTLGVNYGGQSDCASCGKFPRMEGERLCKQCAQQSQLGSRLTRARAVAFFRDAHMESCDVRFLSEYGVRVLDEGELASLQDKPYLIVQINDPDLGGTPEYPATFRYLANHVPRDPNDAPKSFEQIAAESEGRELIGYVKADADHLGRLLAEGLREDDEMSRDSAAHVIAFSRELDLFFSGWLEHALTHRFPDFYTVFSGGDDLFVLGPWSQAIELAAEVNSKFQQFACRNPAVSLSAGILYGKPRYPIRRAAEDVEHVLEESKRTRNCLTVMGDTLKWDQVPNVLGESETLSGFSEQALRSAFLYRLIEYADLYQQAKHAEKAEAARYKSHFAYTVARNLRGGDLRLLGWAKGLIESLFTSQPSATMEHLGLIVTTVLFARRTGRS